MAHFDPGFIIEIDVEHDANRLVEITMLLKGISRRKRHAVIAMLSQEPLDASKHAGVVIDDKYKLPFRQGRWSCFACERFLTRS
jgi:hypothetical protein